MLTDFFVCPQQLLLALTEKNECPWPYGMAFEGGDLFYIPIIALSERKSSFLWVAGFGMGRELGEANFYTRDEQSLQIRG